MNAISHPILQRHQIDDEEEFFLDIPIADVEALRAAVSTLQGEWVVSVETDLPEAGGKVWTYATIRPAPSYSDRLSFEAHKEGFRNSDCTQFQVWAFTNPYPSDDDEFDIEDLDGGRNVLEAFRAVASRLLDPVALPKSGAAVYVERNGANVKQDDGSLFTLETLPHELDGARVIAFDIGSSVARCEAAGWIGNAPGPDGREAAWGPLRATAREAIAAAWEAGRTNRRDGAHKATA